MLFGKQDRLIEGEKLRRKQFFNEEIGSHHSLALCNLAVGDHSSVIPAADIASEALS